MIISLTFNFRAAHPEIHHGGDRFLQLDFQSHTHGGTSQSWATQIIHGPKEFIEGEDCCNMTSKKLRLKGTRETATWTGTSWTPDPQNFERYKLPET